MAKKNKRTVVALECTVCKSRNYTAYRSAAQKEKLTANKYCPVDKKHTDHKQVKI